MDFSVISNLTFSLAHVKLFLEGMTHFTYKYEPVLFQVTTFNSGDICTFECLIQYNELYYIIYIEKYIVNLLMSLYIFITVYIFTLKEAFNLRDGQLKRLGAHSAGNNSRRK